MTLAAKLNPEQLYLTHELMPDQQLFGEIFPIRTDALPTLAAYRLALGGGESPRRVGSKLAEWLMEAFGGCWVMSGGRLITDAAPNPVKLMMALEAARAKQPRAFGQLEGLEEDFHWQPSADEIADYVVRGPVAQVEEAILEALSRTVYTIKGARVVREYRLRTWTVNEEPALSVSVVSRLLYEPDLQAYMETLSTPSEIVGMWVTDKSATVQGEVIKVVGLVREHRQRLLELTQRSAIRELVENAPDDHWVVRVLAGSREYDYVAAALDLVIRPDDIDQFAINRPQIEKALHLRPVLHAQMVKLVSDVLKEAGLIGNSYSTQSAPHLFLSGVMKTNLVFGSSRVRPFNPARLGQDFREGGALHPKTEPVRVVVINTLSDEVGDFLEALKRSLDRDLGLKLEVVRERNMRVISQTNLESAVRLLQKEASDLVLVFLPDENDADEEETVNDRAARAQTVGRGLPCLIVHESTMHKPEAMINVEMGLIARACGVPYLLADPLPYADRVVGLSLIYHSKREGDYLTGVTRIYGNDGALLRSLIAAAPIAESEPLLARLLPRDLLHDLRVVIHSDGKLKRDALRALGSREDELNATFYPVEVIRAGVPRIYAFSAGKIDPPHWGSVFRLSETESFVQSSDTTIQPLHIRSEPPLSIEAATHSVLMFTLLHYGALKAPKLPITVHNADALENGILRGLLPVELASAIPFWL